MKKNYKFIKYSLLLSLLFTISCIVMDILFIKKPFIFDLSIINYIIGISIPIIIMVVTTISISLSLQKEEIFGVQYLKFERLRKQVEAYFSFTKICLFSIIISLLIIICCCLSFYITFFCLICILFFYSIYFCINEIPILCRNEKRIDEILSLYSTMYLNKKDQKNDEQDLFQKITLNLVADQGIVKAYYKLLGKSVNNEILVFEHILNSLRTRIDKVKNNNNVIEKYQVFNDCLKNINIDYLIETNIFNAEKNDDIVQKTYLITRILFAISEEEFFEQNKEEFRMYYSNLFWTLKLNKNELVINVIMQILQNMIIYSVLKDDLRFLNLTLEQFNENKYFLRTNECLNTLFFNVTIFVKYIMNFEPIIPCNIKNNVYNWYFKNDEIIDHTRVENLSKLLNSYYYETSTENPFMLLPKILKYFHLCHWEYYVNLEVKDVVLTDDFIVKNFILDLFNTNYIYSAKTDDLDKLEEKLKDIVFYSVKSFLDEDNKVKINEIKKYTECFGRFDNSKFNEEYFKFLIDFKDKKSLDEILNRSENARKIENSTFSDKIYNNMLNIIKSATGYTKDLKIENSKQLYLYLLIEKDLNVLNYIEAMSSSIANSILNATKNMTKCEAISLDYINKNYKSLKTNNIDNVTNYTKCSILFSNKFNKVDEQLNNYINSLNEVKYSYNLLNNFIFKKDSYGFNIVFDMFDTIDLTDEQVYEIIDDNKKENGQYYYKGAYCNREQIEQIIRDTYYSLKIVFRIEVQCDKNYCFIIDTNETK